MIHFYCLDLETNGTMLKMHEICELSILRASDRVQMTRQVKVDFPNNSSLDALKIIQKTAAELKKGITKQELIQDVEDFLAEDNATPASRCLVGHNIILFDKKFLWNVWERFDKRFPFDMYLDTLEMARKAAKKRNMIKPKLNLMDACNTWEVKKVAGVHNASSDTRNCYLLWQKLMDEVDYLDHIRRMPHIID